MMVRKTDEEVLQEYIEEMELGEVEPFPRSLLLRLIKLARKHEPRINSGVHVIDWMNMSEDDASMDEYYGPNYFKEDEK